MTTTFDSDTIMRISMLTGPLLVLLVFVRMLVCGRWLPGHCYRCSPFEGQ